jgi:hypothetical protein
MFTTRTQMVDYLVSIGKPANIAKAAVNEYCNMDFNGDTRALIYRDDDEQPGVCEKLGEDEDGDVYVRVNEAYTINIYDSFFDMAEVTPEGILCDGFLYADLDGNIIHNK